MEDLTQADPPDFQQLRGVVLVRTQTLGVAPGRPGDIRPADTWLRGLAGPYISRYSSKMTMMMMSSSPPSPMYTVAS